ncbi:hypothetical protein BDP27DRAFT_1326248 [Rhodocollybia butyracea]|uniref:DUF6533 domain-containing protein n=1 Tax=Rhodocollybia butyracea TaxID=206335 RepID=A0A9P5U7N8_9AGAR|nr:hypothetical protein BDP27DRAFT_1326248 [Rhodocollybia butyracea]
MAVVTLVISLIDSQIVVTYDYILSLSQEVAYIWASNWGSVKALYFFRVKKLNPHISSASCHRTMTFNAIFANLGIGISDLILVIRTYALYQRSRKLLVILVITWAGVFVVNVLTASKWDTSDILAFSESITLLGGSSCFLIGEDKTELVNYISLLLGETVVVALTLWRGFRESHTSYPRHGFFGATQSVLITFYRDGLMFYMCILPITLGNALVTVYAPVRVQPLRVIHSILCCKLIVHVREIANPPDDQTRDLSTLFFYANSGGEIQEV